MFESQVSHSFTICPFVTPQQQQEQQQQYTTAEEETSPVVGFLFLSHSFRMYSDRVAFYIIHTMCSVYVQICVIAGLFACACVHVYGSSWLIVFESYTQTATLNCLQLRWYWILYEFTSISATFQIHEHIASIVGLRFKFVCACVSVYSGILLQCCAQCAYFHLLCSLIHSFIHSLIFVLLVSRSVVGQTKVSCISSKWHL